MVKRWIALVGLASLAVAPSARAWFDQGHMMVAAVAWNALTPGAKAHATALLKLNPAYSLWTAGVSPDAVDQTAFLEAATWPDAIKSSSAYTNDGDKPPPGPASSQNVGYSDFLQHRYWHFIDTPFSTDHTPLVQPVPPNAQTQIEAFRAVLADPTAADALKSYDLTWLLHLVGDVHQPLHATSRFSKAHPTGDAGGNLVKVKGVKATELHAFWDGVVGDSDKPADAIAAAQALPAAPAAAAAVSDDAVWIQESFQAAQTTVYAHGVGAGKATYKLSAAYQSQALATAQARIALAGARLANLINTALP